VIVETFDFVIIGAGPAGEAAAFKARELGASVAIIDKEWFGGSCPHIGCIPSKSLLHAAARHAANLLVLCLSRFGDFGIVLALNQVWLH
jgi:pyruvate/2-oxoglutarate dehydrogenase complex dihydrolipoamide dehydrogenase (E3) component